jgi:hypothetical protein
MVGGVRGGRSTHGVCFGVLGWHIEDGRADDVELSGLAAALVIHYDDDEPGSPWSIVVHVDERGTPRQRDAVTSIMLGERGGDDILRLPWVKKTRRLVDVRVSPITLEHADEGGGYVLVVGEAVTAQASRPFPTDEPVRCGIPGYHQPGVELVADRLLVEDAPFAWDLSGNCAFASRFAYQG